MGLWKHYIVLFGGFYKGFYDPGVTSTFQLRVELCLYVSDGTVLFHYLNDSWLLVFDTQDYKWNQVEI
jgi:hypothetical protein